MHAVTMTETGGPEVLGWGAVPDPTPRPGEVVIEVSAAGVNRADLVQRIGRYDPPPGASPILGLECSGTVIAVGPGVERTTHDDIPGVEVGQQVCALLSGGGYAERVAVPVGQVLPLPDGVSLHDAAGLPEVVCTVWSNLVMTAGLGEGHFLLAHGGSSGIGTMAIQVATALGARVAVTASTDEKLRTCRDLGAAVTINYRTEDFPTRVLAATGGRGADVILDVVGGEYLQRNISALADGGRLVIIGLLGGSTSELDIAALMSRRAGVIGTQLRSRPATGRGSKAEVVAEVYRRVWPLIAAGRIRPVIGASMPMDRAADAHRLLRAGEVAGKVILTRPE